MDDLLVHVSRRLPQSRQLLTEMFPNHRLDAEKVEYDPNNRKKRFPHSLDYKTHHGQAPSYEFSFDLIRKYNVATSRDARAYFMRTNQFILVKYNMGGFKRLLHQFSVPIISDHLRKWPIAQVHFEITWPVPPLQQLPDGQPMQRAILCEEQQGHILMLVKDFGKLCDMLKFVCSYNTPPAVYVLSGRGDPVALSTVTTNHSPQVNIRVKDVVFGQPKTLWYERCQEMMEHFKDVTGIGYRLTISCDDKHNPAFTKKNIDAVRALSGPSLIWLHALVMERTITAKQVRADAFRRVGNDLPALTWRIYVLFFYHTIKGRDDIRNLWDPRTDVRDANDQYNPVIAVGTVLDIYLRIEMSALFLRERPNDPTDSLPDDLLDLSRVNLNQLFNAPHRGDWPSLVILHVRHLRLFVELAENVNRRVSEIIDNIRLATQNIKEMPYIYPTAQRDLEVVEPYLDPDATVMLISTCTLAVY